MRRISLMTLAGVVFLLIAAGSAGAGESPPNLLPNPGFENLEESFIEEGMLLQRNESAALGEWTARCLEGKIRVRGDRKERIEGDTSLEFELLSSDTENECYIACTVPGVKPNTIYELRAMIKTYNIGWCWSHCRIFEYAEDGTEVGGDHRRLTNYPTSPEFLERKTWYATGPRADRIMLIISWKGRPQTVGIVQQPSMVWMDDLRFEDVGPAYPVSGKYLHDDFESKELKDWILVQAGADWQPTGPGFGDERNPRISEEKAHSGKRSLKLTPTWGMIERPFAARLTDCVVTAWFYEEPGDRCRMVMLVDRHSFWPLHLWTTPSSLPDGMRVGLGTHRQSRSNYVCVLGGKGKGPATATKSSVLGGALVTAHEKSAEWHEFKFDVTKGKGITCYIDGAEVGQTDLMDSFRSLQLGENLWRGGTCYIDDISIQLKVQQ